MGEHDWRPRRFGVREFRNAGKVVVLLVACSLVVHAAGVASGQSADSRRSKPRPSAEAAQRSLAPALKEQKARESSLERRRDRPSAVQARLRSRTAYARLSATRTRKVLAAKLRPFVRRRFPAGPALATGERIERYIGERSALVAAGGKRYLMEATMPLRSNVGVGKQAPVNLALRSAPGAFVAANPLAPYSIARDLRAGIRFPDAGVAVVPVAPRAPKPGVLEGKVLYPNALRDTDVLVSPAATGIETAWTLRSARSPQRLALAYRLPKGLRVRARKSGSGFEVVRGSEVVLTTGTVFAADADGVPVRATTRLAGDRILIRVAHRDADVRYPIAVDPSSTVHGFHDDDFVNNDRWSFAYGGPPWNTSRNGSLWLGHSGAFAYGPGAYGEWRYTPPGSAFVWRFETWSEHGPDNDATQAHTGIMRANGSWESGVWTSNIWTGSGYVSGQSEPSVLGHIGQHSETHCVVATCNAPDYRYAPGGDTRYYTGDRAVFRVFWHQPNNIGSAQAWGNLYWGAVYVEDPDTPSLSAISSGVTPGRWYRSGTPTASVRATDGGLGVVQVDLQRDASAIATRKPKNGAADCSGDYGNRCPLTFDTSAPYDIATFADGPREMTFQAWDINGHASTRNGWWVNVDKTAPLATPGGSLYDARKGGPNERWLTSGTYTLSLTGIQDGGSGTRAGVRDVKFEIKNLTTGAWQTLATTTNACTGDSCAMADQSFDFRPADHADGLRTLRVVVADRAGTLGDANDANVKTTQFDVQVGNDVTGPQILRADGPLRRRWLASQGYDLRIDAKDFAGSAAAINEIRGGSFEGEMPRGHYAYRATASAVTGEVPAVHGAYVAKLVANSNDGLAEIGNDNDLVAVRPGETVALTASARSTAPGRRLEVAARFMTSSGGWIGKTVLQPVELTADQWGTARGAVTTPSNAAYVAWETRVAGLALNEVAYVDAVQLEHGPPSGGYAPHADETPGSNSAGTNLVPNSSFEGGTLPPGTAGSAGTVQATNQAGGAAHGAYGARLQQTGTGAISHIFSDTGRVAVQPGENLTLSAYAKATAGGRKLRVSFRYFTSSGAWLSAVGSPQIDLSAAAWRRNSVTVAAPSGAATAGWEVRIDGMAENEAAYIDAIQLERGDFKTPYGLRREEVPADHRSGVTSLELLDGTATHASQTWTCPDGSCMRSHTLAYNAVTAAEGRHQLSVRAKDAAGNQTTTKPWEVVVDKSVPKVLSVTGPLRTQSFVGAGSTPVRIDASDSGSTAAPRNLLPAASFERGLPYGFSSWLAYANVVNGPLTAPDGTNYVRAVQFGGGPHVLNDYNRLNVVPGEKVAFSAYVRASVPTGRTFRAEPRWFDANGNPSWTTHAETAATDSAWTRVQNVFTAPSNARQMTWQVKMLGGANGEAFYVDAIQVERAAAVSAFQRSSGEGPDAEQRAGIGKLELGAVPAGGGSPTTWSTSNVCLEDSCPRSDWLSLDDRAPEGRLTLTATAEDMIGRRASAPTWQTIVDRSAPTVATAASLARTQDPDTLAFTQTYKLQVDAADGSTASAAQERSGVTRIEVQVRDEANTAAGFVSQPPDATQTCPQGSCALSRSFSMVRTGGRYTVRVIATDQVGNRRVRDRIATFDDRPPDIALSGTLKDNENGTLVAGAYDLRIKATDEDRSKTIQDTFDDGTVEPWWSWSYGTPRPWEADGTGHTQCTSAYTGFYSSRAVDLADSAATVEVVRLPPVGNNTTQTYMQLIRGGDKIEIGRDGSSLYMYEKVNGATVNQSMPYDTANHRWWRIKDDEGDLLWQTSPDGATWQTHWRKASEFPRSGLDTAMGCGYWGTESNPGDAQFDNYSVGEPARGSGVKSIEVLLRRDDVPGIFERKDFKQQSCPDGNCSMDRTWVFRPEQYPQGSYTVRVESKDQLGNTSQKDLRVNVGSQSSNMRHSIGLEDFWNYESVETGAGTAAHVDLATGNLVWHSVPLVNPGRGLSTVMNVTYNQQTDPDDPRANTALEYDEAGLGMSVGVSGLTRLNEPLDVSAATGILDGDVVLTDADGTRHVFKPASDGPLDLDLRADSWIAPPGVQLHLRRWSPGLLTPAERNKAWAATRPDGVTFFFDSNGYQTSIEDRNGNVLRFDYVYASATSTPCTILNSAIDVPDIGQVDDKVCIYKLQQIVDSAGVKDGAPNRAVSFTYHPRAGAPLDQPPSGRLKDVTDHAGRKLTFAYQDKYLSDMTQAAGSSVQRSFRFEYYDLFSTGRKLLTSVTDPRQAATASPAKTNFNTQRAPAGVDARFPFRTVSIYTRTNAHRDFDYSRDATRPNWPNATRAENGREDATMHYSDAAGRPRESVDPYGTVTRLDFDDDNNVTTLVAAAGSPDEATSRMEYNPLGQLTAQIDPENRRTELTYREGSGTIKSPRGTDEGQELVGDLVATTTPRGFGGGVNRDDFTWRYTVDDQGNVRERFRPGVAEPARNEYGAFGLVTAAVSEVGDRTEFRDHDPNGLPRTQSNPKRPDAPDSTDGDWKYTYDGVGNVLTVTDPRGDQAAGTYQTRFTYDALDRALTRTRTLDSAGGSMTPATEEFKRDGNDNLTRYTDARGKFWDTTYTPMDRPELSSSPAVAHADGTTGVESTRMSYDVDDNVTKVEAPEGVRTTNNTDDFSTFYEYDKLSRPVVERRRERTSPTGHATDLVTSYAYDRRDNVVGVVDPRHNAAGGDPVTNAGDTAKRRFTYVYDRAGQQTSATEDPGGLALRTEYGYDLNGNRTSVTDPRGTVSAADGDYTTRWGFNAYDEMTSMTDAASKTTLYERRGDGLVTFVTAPKGVETADTATDYRTELRYYPTGAVKSRSLPRDAQQYPSAGSSLTRRIVWRRNAVGDPTCITDARSGLAQPDADCSNRYSFRNTFLDTGELATTERPSWWTIGANGLEERDPLEMGARGGKPELPTSGNGEGDFGGVDRLEMPDLLPAAGKTWFGYDSALSLTSIAQKPPVVDGADRVTTLTRDAVDRITSIDRPFNGANRILESSKYDYNGNLSAATDARRFETFLTYDQFDRRTKLDAPGDGITATREVTELTFDENDNVTKTRTPRLTDWKSTYDAVDREASSIDPFQRTTTFGYDGAGNRTLVKTHLQRRFTSEFDGRNLVTREIDPLGHHTDFGYDANGNRTVVDAPPSSTGAGPRQITRTRFEGRDLPWTRTTGSGANRRVRGWEFDPAGNLRREVAPSGINSNTGLPRETDDAPYKTDPADAGDKSRESVRLATKYSTLNEYDSDSLLTSIHAAWGDADTDPDGKQTTEDDKRRYRQDFIRNNRGWVTSADHSYEWTKASPQTARTSYTYFDTGWIETATEPVHTRAGTTDRVGGDKATYTYYETGDQRRWATGRDGVDRREVQRTVAPNGTLTTRTASATGETTRSYEYRFDRNHNLTSFKDLATSGTQAGRTTTITNDDLDRAIKINESWTGGKDSVFFFDEDGRLTERRTDGRVGATVNDYTGGTRTRFTYDDAGREIRTIVARSAEPDRTMLTSWFPSGQRAARVRCNAVAEAPAACPPASVRATDTYEYADDRRLIKKVRTPRTGSAETDTYEYDSNGNRSKDERGKHTFNARDQLTSWTKGDKRTRYKVDGDGATLELREFKVVPNAPDQEGKSVVYGYTGDQLDKATIKSSPTATASTVHYCHSAFGNVERITSNAAATRCTGTALTTDAEYGYDAFERMTSSREPTKSATTYQYDGLDRRDSKTAGTAKTDFSYIGLSESLSRETQSSGPIRDYDYDSDLNRIGFSARPSATQTPVYRGYRHDANGSVTGLEGDDGGVAASERYEYDPYGELQVPDNVTVPTTGNGTCSTEDRSAGLTDAACAQPFRFEGFYYDSGVKTYDMQARAYRPDIGRFLTTDRYESSAGDFNLQADPLTQNRWAFAGGNPVNRIEFDGHEPPTSFNRRARQKMVDKDGDCFRDCDPGPSQNSPAPQGPDWYYQRGSDSPTATEPAIGAGGKVTDDGLPSGGGPNPPQKVTVRDLLKLTKDLLIGDPAHNPVDAAALAPTPGKGARIGGKIIEAFVRAARAASRTAKLLNRFTPVGRSRYVARMAAKAAIAEVRADKSIKVSKGPVFGTKVHSKFAEKLEATGMFRVEQSYKLTKSGAAPARYAEKGSVRLDAIAFHRGKPVAIFDLKTGSATLDAQRIREIRMRLPNDLKNLPIEPIKPR